MPGVLLGFQTRGVTNGVGGVCLGEVFFVFEPIQVNGIDRIDFVWGKYGSVLFQVFWMYLIITNPSNGSVSIWTDWGSDKSPNLASFQSAPTTLITFSKYTV